MDTATATATATAAVTADMATARGTRRAARAAAGIRRKPMEEKKIDRRDEGAIDISRLLQEFLPVLKKLFWIPLALAAIVGALWFAKGYFSYTPMYACEVTFTIQVSASGNTEQSSGYSYYNKATAEQLGKTFPYLIQSDLMYSKLKKELGVSVINGSITAETMDNTNLFTMRVTSSSPRDAKAILEAVIKVYPEVADYVIGSTTMNLLTDPVEPTVPYNSFSPVKTFIKGAIVGLIIGFVFLMLCAAIRNTVREPDDIRIKLNQTCLATLPKVTFKKRKQHNVNTLSILNKRVSGSFQESIRSLRIKLLRRLESGKCYAILVTSTMPGEGKTTVSTNLALALSKNGARVILVDMDLRRPSVKKALGITTPSNGLVELRERKVKSVGECLSEIEGSTLKLLAGDVPRKSTRPISARWLKSLIDMLRGQADFIIVDTPPCGLLADSANIASAVDSALYVIGAGGVEISQILDSLQFLSESGTSVIGCVLNGVETHLSGGYGYGYGYGYGGYSYGYGYRHREDSDSAANAHGREAAHDADEAESEERE
ncbi:MAG: hypothetical protein DBX62_09925 [Clostridia bacterium]|nr:MAG: hypothetical protein DBX62_09925 [Clostridia bacterium]